MAKYDLPAMIDMVLHITKRSCIYYIGHSQGTLTMFAMLSQNPVYSQKVCFYYESNYESKKNF